MATIIAFKAARKSTEPSVLATYGRGRSAEIVLFPGVRYERHAEAEASQKPKKPRRRRDRLDLHGNKRT